VVASSDANCPYQRRLTFLPPTSPIFMGAESGFITFLEDNGIKLQGDQSHKTTDSDTAAQTGNAATSSASESNKTTGSDTAAPTGNAATPSVAGSNPQSQSSTGNTSPQAKSTNTDLTEVAKYRQKLTNDEREFGPNSQQVAADLRNLATVY